MERSAPCTLPAQAWEKLAHDRERSQGRSRSAIARALSEAVDRQPPVDGSERQTLIHSANGSPSG